MIDLIMYSFVKYADNLIAVSILLLGGFYFRFVMQAFGQTWIMTKAHTATIIILPIITYVITSLISGNIALSLGMVGALSIVRFRNPVRSPLELSTYFGAITMGIAASVSIKWLLFLILSISVALISLIVVDFLYQKILDRPLFTTSFSEGNSLSILTIKVPNPISECEESDMLQSKVVSEDSITYSFTSSNFSKLKEFEQINEVQSNIVSSELRR